MRSNSAPHGGARIALMALDHMIADDKTGKEGQKIDGYRSTATIERLAGEMKPAAPPSREKYSLPQSALRKIKS